MSGFDNFGNSFGRFRNAEENNHEFRYASPYDEPEYQPPKPKYVAPRPAPAPYHPSAPYQPPSPPSVRCPQNLLIGCAPQVQYVPCQQPHAYN